MEITSTESTIQFQEGLIGFYDCKSFRLIAREEIAPFRWLQSTDRPDIGFLVIDPSLVISGYKTIIPNREWESLGIADPKREWFLSRVWSRHPAGPAPAIFRRLSW